MSRKRRLASLLKPHHQYPVCRPPWMRSDEFLFMYLVVTGQMFGDIYITEPAS